VIHHLPTAKAGMLEFSVPKKCRLAAVSTDFTGEPTRTNFHLPDPLSNTSPFPVSSHEERFLPGTVLAGRYRVVNLLGRGGMGEVYRATDLTLQQTVALKFVLPEFSSHDQKARDRFLNEVRAAREISHPNVCRVHDIGELDGHLYLSMEFVDGEDLASLLALIGRLPTAKTNELAAGICAGLAAAHRKGLLHRDLKPANIMIDGHGLPRLMDFGLAAGAGRVAANEVRQGTPAYMAPEQLAGREVTVQSDLYALGLILYELYTGRRPFEASSPSQFLAQRERNAAPEPSTLCPDLDTSTERIILECLSPDPGRRPASAAAIAARLPYKDALAAVLASGDTPSPGLVAASGDSVPVRRRVAWSWAAVVLAGLAAGILLRATHAESVPDQPPEVLAHNARILARQIGYTGAPADTAYGFLQGGLLKFWYRESNAPLEAAAFPNIRHAPGRVTPEDPPMAPGMVSIETDAHGRLTKFFAMPDTVPVPGESEKRVDWNPFFAAAELDPSRFTPDSPPAQPLFAADSTFAWTGNRTSGAGSESGVKLRALSASAAHGRVVYFEVTPYASMSESAGLLRERSRVRAIGGILMAILVPVIFFLAYRNIRQGRIDREGAFLVAAAMFWICLAEWIVVSRHGLSLQQLTITLWALFWAVGNSALAWICFVAAEPNLRRLGPGVLVSVQKLLTGAKLDAQVGRDLIWGMVIAVCCSFPAVAAGKTAPNGPTGFTPRGLAGLWLGDLRLGLFFGLLGMLLILPIALRFRKTKTRFGVLAIIVAETGFFAIRDLPPITDFSSWSAQAPLIGYVLQRDRNRSPEIEPPALLDAFCALTEAK
jgi:Protein kinase domain